MKKILSILVFQLILAIIAAILMSQMSWWGRIGISLFHKDYEILKEPIKTAPIIFGVQGTLVLILHVAHAFTKRKISRIICVLILILSIIALIYTIYDFRETFSYRILKAKFHYGFYLIWIGIMISSIYYFFLPKRKSLNSVKEADVMHFDESKEVESE